MNTKGVFIDMMKIRGLELQHRVHVIPGLHEQLILGIDLIREKGLGYCPQHHEFHWEALCLKEHGLALQTKEKLMLPPLCRRIYRVSNN